MGTVSELLAKLHADRSSNAGAPDASSVDRDPEHMIAGCEYELRQMWRDMRATRAAKLVPGSGAAIREPFVLGARLRNREYRAAIDDAARSASAEKSSGGQ